MRHIAYTLGIFFFSQGLYANINVRLDTSFKINKPSSILPNPWISAIFGYPQGSNSIGTPKIICNFRNIPSANLFVGAVNLHSAWLKDPKFGPSKTSPAIKDNYNYSSFLHKKKLFTHHRISFIENYFQQEHSIELQLPVSKKISISTGIGFIHTNQYGYINSNAFKPNNSIIKPSKLPIIGKIQVIKTLPNAWSFFSNATITTSNLNSSNKLDLNSLSQSGLNQHQSTLSFFENNGIPWHYTSTWNWNIQSALLITGPTVKIPCLLRTSTGNNGSIAGFTTWLPIHLNYLQQIEITLLNGESPLFIGFIGQTTCLKNTIAKNSFQWKAGFLWNNNIGIIPHLTFLLNL